MIQLSSVEVEAVKVWAKTDNDCEKVRLYQPRGARSKEWEVELRVPAQQSGWGNIAC